MPKKDSPGKGPADKPEGHPHHDPDTGPPTPVWQAWGQTDITFGDVASVTFGGLS